MLETNMRCSQGDFKLQRFPVVANEKLRAWDAADEYLLEDIASKLVAYSQPKILIINDSFGALAVALAAFKPDVVSDSFIAHSAINENLALNKQEPAVLLSSLQIPEKTFDIILIKAPKTLAFLEDSLARIQPCLTANTQVILAGMVKNMSPAVWQLLEKYIGTTIPSKAVKKARLIYATVDSQRDTPVNPFPSYYTLENTEYKICNHANVFSRQKLDIGTRFFLEHLPISTKYQQVVDLGCGNGVVGVVFAGKNPDAELHFIDESFMAVASAEDNFKHAFADRSATFEVNDALSSVANNSMDLVLCNPPFHEQNVIGGHIALRMFKQAKQVLRAEGELWVIGNRHLGYHAILKRLFPTVQLIATNNKFVILKAMP